MFDKNIPHYKAWNIQELLTLNIEAIADSPSFIFLWVGS